MVEGPPAEKQYTEKLTKVDEKKLKEMRRLFPNEDPATVRRFLAARGTVTKGSEMLKAHIQWRRKALPVDRSKVQKELATNKFFVDGVDNEGHPLLHFIGPNHDPKKFTLKETTTMMTYVLEEGIKAMKPGIEKFTACLFLPGCSDIDTAFVRAAADLFGNNYPERMYKVMVFPTGFVSRGIWALVKGFIDPATAAKTNLLPGGRQPPDLKKSIPIDSIYKLYGGNNPFNPCPQLKPKQK